MVSAEHEPITGVWGQSPRRGPGAEPLVRGSGAQSPPEAESILVIGCPMEPANLAPFQKCLALSICRHCVKPVRTIETQFRQYHVTKVGGLVI